MKKALLTMVFLYLTSLVQASKFGELFDSVAQDSKFTILESVTPLYYYDAIEKINQGGFSSSFYLVGNGFLTADAGWVNSIEDSTKKGGVLLGGSVHAGKVAQIFVPKVVEHLRGILPDSSLKFVDAVNVGLAFKHNFERDAFTFGFFSGVDLRF